MDEPKRVTARAFSLSKTPPLNARTLQKLAERGRVEGMEEIAGAYTAYPDAWEKAWASRNTKVGRPKGNKKTVDPGPSPQ